MYIHYDGESKEAFNKILADKITDSESHTILVPPSLHRRFNIEMDLPTWIERKPSKTYYNGIEVMVIYESGGNQVEVTKGEVTIDNTNLSHGEKVALAKLVEKSTMEHKLAGIKRGTEYYYITSRGYIEGELYWAEDEDERRIVLGNGYKTEDAAKFEVERRIVEYELKLFAKEYNEKPIDWQDSKQDKCFICYDHESDNFIIGVTTTQHFSGIFFTSDNVARKAIDYIGAKRLKKYHFNIKED